MAALISIAACSDQGAPSQSSGPIPPEQIAQELRRLANEGKFFRAGEWQSSVTIKQISGMDEGTVDDIGARVRQQSYANCLTEEAVREPDADFFVGEGSDCTYSHFAMADGRIEAEMRCATGTILQDTRLSGTFDPTHYTLDLTSEGSGPGGVSMAMTIDAKRVGDCAKPDPDGAPTSGESDDE